MNKRLKILIGDYDEDFRSQLKQRFCQSELIEGVYDVDSGEELIRKACECDVDIILTEYLLRGIDGLLSIKKILKTKIDKRLMIYVLTSFASKEVMQEAVNVGVNHLMIKPIAIDYLVERIEEYVRTGQSQFKDRPILTMDEKIKIMRLPVYDQIVTFLSKIKFRNGVKGFEYVATASDMIIKDRSVVNMITKVVYPQIAQKYSTTPQNVERGIRSVIETTWDSKAREFREMFPENETMNRRPTNAQFLSTFTDTIRLEMKMNQTF